MQGSECDFRHSDAARMNPRDCWYWFNGNCANPKCSFRHPVLPSSPVSTILQSRHTKLTQEAYVCAPFSPWTIFSARQQLRGLLNSPRPKFLLQLKASDLFLLSRLSHVITFRKACAQKGAGVPSRTGHSLLHSSRSSPLLCTLILS
jgi:hypothetical protein